MISLLELQVVLILYLVIYKGWYINNQYIRFSVQEGESNMKELGFGA